jgi:hypothetical protein
MKICIVIIVMASLMCGASCKKTQSGGGLASLNLINADPNLASAYIYFTNTDTAFYAEQSMVSYGSSIEYGLAAGSNPVAIYNTQDTIKPAFKGDFTLKPGGMYSFYLCGTGEMPDTLFMQDVIPVQPDSTAGARFVDLCTDCGQVNVTLQGNSQPDFPNLTYKQVAAFKSYSANSAVLNNGGYTYVITDGLGNQVASFNWNPPIFKNNTLVICGVDSLASVEVFSVNNY